MNMEETDTQIARKRKMDDMGQERSEANEENGEEENDVNFTGSEEMKLGISRILEKVEAFNQLVSEMLESGKSLFNKLNQEFEERVLMIHKEQIEKWQEEIKELRMIDTSNEEMNVRLNNVKSLLQTVHLLKKKIFIRCILASLVTTMNILYRVVMDPGGKSARKWNQIFFVAIIVSLFIDPLFFFSPTVRVQKDSFCVENEAFLDTTFIILRSLNDVFYWLHMLFQFRTAYVAPSSRVFGIGELIVHPTKIALRYLTKAFWLDLLAALPIPQVLVWAVIPHVKGSMIWDLKIILRFLIFFQYFYRFCRLYPLSLQAMNATGVVSENIWLRTAGDLLLFYVASHISGACWYLFTIERQEECWKSACYQERQSCSYENFDCRNGWFVSSNVTRLCDPDSGYYQFGVYVLGVTTGASSLPFSYKYSYALWIGLQAICSTGQTLVPSIYISENIYSIIVGTVGLLLLASIITNMQRNLLSVTARLEEWRFKRNDIEEWMHNRQLPPELKQHVQRYDRHKWLATRGVDEKSLLSAFPAELQREIKRHLCLNLVRQVPVFENMDELTLDVICERLEPALYTEGTFIVREGDPVNEILFIIRGQLDSYTTDGGRGFSSTQIGCGGFCGDELFTWVLDSCSCDSFPPSTRTIRAISDIETFCLKAEDLKFVASQFPTLHSRNLRHKFKLYSQQWRTWAACYIQAAWKRYKMRKTLTELSVDEVCSSSETLASTEDHDMDIFVPRPDAGIEVYAARLITNLRREKSKRYSSDSGRFSHSVTSVESQRSLDHGSNVS